MSKTKKLDDIISKTLDEIFDSKKQPTEENIKKETPRLIKIKEKKEKVIRKPIDNLDAIDKPYIFRYGKKIVIRWIVNGVEINIPVSDRVRTSQLLVGFASTRGTQLKDIETLFKTVKRIREAMWQIEILRLLMGGI